MSIGMGRTVQKAHVVLLVVVLFALSTSIYFASFEVNDNGIMIGHLVLLVFLTVIKGC
jgi:hypothetical protein